MKGTSRLRDPPLRAQRFVLALLAFFILLDLLWPASYELVGGIASITHVVNLMDLPSDKSGEYLVQPYAYTGGQSWAQPLPSSFGASAEKDEAMIPLGGAQQGKRIVPRLDIALASHLTAQHLPNYIFALSRWGGYGSIAIFIPSREEYDQACAVLHLMHRCHPNLMAVIDVHFVFLADLGAYGWHGTGGNGDILGGDPAPGAGGVDAERVGVAGMEHGGGGGRRERNRRKKRAALRRRGGVEDLAGEHGGADQHEGNGRMGGDGGQEREDEQEVLGRGVLRWTFPPSRTFGRGNKHHGEDELPCPALSFSSDTVMAAAHKKPSADHSPPDSPPSFSNQPAQANYALRVPYPNNLLRNVAIMHARSDAMLVIDADMVPSPTLAATALELLQKADPNDKVALVAPAFETKEDVPVPAFKAELLKLLRDGDAEPFYYQLCAKCQNTTDFPRWSATAPGTRATYEVGWKDPWEPLYVARRSTMPLYDERFKQYGFNRISQVCEAHIAGFRFLVLTDDFVIHPGFKSTFHASKEQEQGANRMLFRTFKQELKQKYPGVARRCY